MKILFLFLIVMFQMCFLLFTWLNDCNKNNYIFFHLPFFFFVFLSVQTKFERSLFFFFFEYRIKSRTFWYYVLCFLQNVTSTVLSHPIPSNTSSKLFPLPPQSIPPRKSFPFPFQCPMTRYEAECKVRTEQ